MATPISIYGLLLRAGYNFDTNLKSSLSMLVKMQLLDNASNYGQRGGYFLTDRGARAAKLISHD